MNENNEIRFCKKCGAKRSPNYKYCLHCGESFFKENNQFSQTGLIEEELLLEEETHQEELIYCPDCGMERIMEDIYCIECGHKYGYIPSIKTSSNNIYSNIDNNYSSENNGSRVLLVLAIINAVLFMPIAGLIAFIMFILTLIDFEFVIYLLLSAAYFVGSIIFLVKQTKKSKN